MTHGIMLADKQDAMDKDPNLDLLLGSERSMNLDCLAKKPCQ